MMWTPKRGATKVVVTKKMRNVFLGVASVLYAATLVVWAQAPPAPATGQPARVVELDLRGMIQPMTAEYVAAAFDEAARSNASLILIQMDTPGGYDSSMREIITRIINSPVPVAVYVGPSGARAASAGFYILLSADIAAMGPGTHTGAASPVLVSLLSGASVPVDETMRKKIMNDATAYLRSITTKRNRNAEAAETAITEARAFTEGEALRQNMIDLLADTPEALLAKLDGREIQRFDGRKVKLDLKNPVRSRVEETVRQRFLGRILHPDAFFILLVVGAIGLYTEFTHPGLFAPGIIGGIALVLALYAMQLIPVNVAGLLLIALAIAMFVLEAKFTSHGLLGLGGAVAMVLGALMLIRRGITPVGVSLGAALSVTIPFALITVFLMRLVMKSFRWRMATGAEQMVGMVGEVTQALAPRDGAGSHGMVFVNGELWRAAARQEIPKGAAVRVVKVDGLTVHVEPVAAAAPEKPL